MELLASFHYRGSQGLDFSRCFPEAEMNSDMVNWDLNYFKYSFLKLTSAAFSEPALQQDFNRLQDHLMRGYGMWNTFMYRDFQSRNIIVNEKNGGLVGIDFQGGRRGPAAYDLASFLWQAKAALPTSLRMEALDEYCSFASNLSATFSAEELHSELPYFVLFRLLQTLGAYGFRGMIERRPHFLESIPMGIQNLKALFSKEHPHLQEEFPALASIARSLALPAGSDAPSADGPLTVTVQSFSYRKGYPVDYSGNGGGFVFDCRAVHNPGRYEQYKPLTGLDLPVREFLEKDGEILTFLQSVYLLTDAAVEKYIKRGFTSLCVSFGCTGGRHRSVYSAHATAEHLRVRYPHINVVEIHREQPHLNPTSR